MCKYYVLLIIRKITKILYILPMKKNRILFYTYSGNNCTDSPWYIAEALERERGNKFEIIWAVNDTKKWRILEQRGWKVIKYKSLKHIYYSATSKFIVTNTGPFKAMGIRKNQEIINTWHGGGAYKKTGQNNPYKNKYQIIINKKLGQAGVTLFLSSSSAFKKNAIVNAFDYCGNIMECGLPRNDVFFLDEKNIDCITQRIRGELNIRNNIHIVLFAPTWRNYDNNEFEKLDYKRVVECIKKRFGGNWVFAFRGHHFMQGINNLNEYKDYIDLSSYQDMQKILLITDVLISDYSSAIWDFSLTYKPCFLYTPDLNMYEHTFGFYTEINTWGFPYACTMKKLCENIISFDSDTFHSSVNTNHSYFGMTETGHACEAVLNYINERL